MSSLESVTSSIQSHHNDTEFDTLFLNPLIHLIDEKPNATMFPKPTHLPTSDDQLQPNLPQLNQYTRNFIKSSESMFNINIERPQPQQDCNQDAKKLFVGNLPANTNFNEIMELFRQYGCVNEHLSTVKEDNYAFIHYYSGKDAECAQRSLNNSYFKSRYIRVQYSHSTGHIKKSKSNCNILLANILLPLFNYNFIFIAVNFKEMAIAKNNGMFFNLPVDNHIQSSMSNSCSLANFNTQPLSTIPQYSNKFPSSTSMYDIPRVQVRRPITGGNRRCLSKSNASLNAQKSYDALSTVSASYSTQSLLIPASSQINIHNQIRQLQQLDLVEQNQQFLKKYSSYGASSDNEPASSSRSIHNEFNLFGHGGSSLFELANPVVEDNVNQSPVV